MTNRRPSDPSTNEISQKDFLNRLARLCETRSDEIRSLKFELTCVRTKLRETEEHASRLANGLEGTCICCEKVAVRNQEMVNEIFVLREERDKARRMFCEVSSEFEHYRRTEIPENGSVEDYARNEGWDGLYEEIK